MFNSVDTIRKENLVTIQKKIHEMIPLQNFDTYTVANYEIKEGIIDGQPINRLIIFLRASGCKWMLNDGNGGCTMCGHLVGTVKGKKVSAGEYGSQINNIFEKIDLTKIPMLCLYNAGSFFCDEEIDQDARAVIYDIIAHKDEIKYVIIESRPEYITEEKIEILRKALPDKTIEIGMGLESSNGKWCSFSSN